MSGLTEQRIREIVREVIAEVDAEKCAEVLAGLNVRPVRIVGPKYPHPEICRHLPTDDQDGQRHAG